MHSKILFLFLFIAFFSFSQQDSLRKKLIFLTVADYRTPPAGKRKFISLQGKGVVTKINPLTYVAGTLMFIYQRVLSEQIQANCNYELSCSNYTKHSMEKHGMLAGALLGTDQFISCFPGVTGDYEKCMINKDGKIINHEAED